MDRVGRCVVDAEAVLFDLDGVLVDSTGSVERLWRAFADRHGLDAQALLHDLHGRRMVDIVTAALPDLSPSDLLVEVARMDAAEVADAAAGTRVLPGALALTSQLTASGARWAVVTSGTPDVARARLRVVGMAPPPVVVTAADVAAGKPDPEPYLMAAEQLGVAPGRCLVVEDAPSGIEAARRAGATVVAVTTSHDPSRLTAASHRVASVADLALLPGGGGARLRLACRPHATTGGAADEAVDSQGC